MTAREDAYTAERARLLRVFGENLRGLRERQNLTQEEFAEVASVHRNEIGTIGEGAVRAGSSHAAGPRRRAGGPVEGADGRSASAEGAQAREREEA
jgi:hypothetical protein